MATIVTDSDFNDAASYWLTANSITGATKIPADRKIFSSTNVDITPSTAVLEAALDSFLIEAALQEARDAAAEALITGKVYLRAQLEKTPGTLPSLTVIVTNNIKPVIDGNPVLSNMMQNMLNLMNPAYTWTPTVTMSPANDLARARYLMAAITIVSLTQ